MNFSPQDTSKGIETMPARLPKQHQITNFELLIKIELRNEKS